MFGFEENYIRKASEKINDLIMSRVKYLFFIYKKTIVKQTVS